MSDVEAPARACGTQDSAAEAAMPCPTELRLARANLLEALTVKFTNLFTAIIANCEMAVMETGPEHRAYGFLVAAKAAAYEANDANGRIRALVKECREALK